MTSDAKIGLILGLVFIFIIAFIINGLPKLRGETDSNELTEILVTNESPGVGGLERRVESEILERPRLGQDRPVFDFGQDRPALGPSGPGLAQVLELVPVEAPEWVQVLVLVLVPGLELVLEPGLGLVWAPE